MIIYTDIITDDELLSDAYDLKVVDGVVIEADSAMINIKPGADVDIGANPSAEGGDDDAVEEGTETVNNIVYSFQLTPTSFDKKSFMVYLKDYFKKIKAQLNETDPSAVAEFEKGAQTYAKKVLGNFKDYEFYIGNSMNPDGMVVLLNWREDGTTPYLIFWKHGLKETKV